MHAAEPDVRPGPDGIHAAEQDAIPTPSVLLGEPRASRVPDEIRAAEQDAIPPGAVPFEAMVPGAIRPSAQALAALLHAIPEHDETPHEARV